MAITEAAQRHHDELFPNHRSTLKITDPELIGLFDNWAFDEILRHGGLDTKTRLMVQLAGHVAGNVAVGNDRSVLVGTITQLLPFIGYPRALNALRIIDEGT